MSDLRRTSTMPALYEAGSSEEVRKRVSKACDRCRLKKIKCDGRVPCSRCQTDSTICRYGERKKSVERRIPPGYVDYLEEQQKVLVQALRKVWSQSSSALTRSPSAGEPSVNEILSSLGVLDEFTREQPGRENFTFEEDLDVIRRRLEEEDDAAVTSASSARSSPSRSSIPAPVEPFRDPFANRSTMSLPSSSGFRLTMPERRIQALQSRNWQPSPSEFVPESVQPQFEMESSSFSPLAFQTQPQPGDMEWTPETQQPMQDFQNPALQSRRGGMLTPGSAFAAYQSQFGFSPAFGFRSSPQPQSQQQQQQQQRQGSQNPNTPGANWLADDDDAWQHFINERRE